MTQQGTKTTWLAARIATRINDTRITTFGNADRNLNRLGDSLANLHGDFFGVRLRNANRVSLCASFRLAGHDRHHSFLFLGNHHAIGALTSALFLAVFGHCALSRARLGFACHNGNHSCLGFHSLLANLNGPCFGFHFLFANVLYCLRCNLVMCLANICSAG